MLLGVTGNTDTKSCFGCKTWLVYGKASVTYLRKWSEGRGEQILLQCLSCGMEKKKLWYLTVSSWFGFSIMKFILKSSLLSIDLEVSQVGMGRGEKKSCNCDLQELVFSTTVLHGLQCTVFTKHVLQNRWNCQFREVSCYIQSCVCYWTVNTFFEPFNV